MRVRGVDEAREQSRIDSAAPGDKPGRGASSYPGPKIAAPVGAAAEGAAPRGRADSAAADRAPAAGTAAKAASTSAGLSPRAEQPLSPTASPEIPPALGREALPARLTEHLRSLGLAADGPGLIAARALMAEYLPIDLTRLRALAPAMKRAEAAGKSPLDAARLAARALAAGLDPDDWPPEALEPPPGGDGQAGSSGGGGGAHGQAPGWDGRGAGGRSGRAAVGPAEADRLAELLRGCAARSLSDGRMRAFAAPNPAGLGWLYAPFELGEAGFEFRGTMRILYNYRTGRGERLVVEADGMGDPVTISLSGLGDALRARAYGLKDAEAKALRRLGVAAESGSPSAGGGAWEPGDA